PSMPDDTLGHGTDQGATGWGDWHFDPIGLSSYACNAQVFGKCHQSSDPTDPYNGWLEDWQGQKRIPGDFQDGTSQTVLFAERYAQCGSINYNIYDPTGGINGTGWFLNDSGYSANSWGWWQTSASSPVFVCTQPASSNNPTFPMQPVGPQSL